MPAIDTCAYCTKPTFPSNLTPQGPMDVCRACIADGANYYTYRCIDCEDPLPTVNGEDWASVRCIPCSVEDTNRRWLANR